MATKRKTRSGAGMIDEKPDESMAEIQAAFRRHFNARFAPLDLPQSVSPDCASEQSSDETENDSDWSGFSSSADDNVQIVTVPSRKRSIHGEALQADHPSIATSTVAKHNSEERLHMLNDIKLQRLISESSLLKSSNDGKLKGQRHKVMESRLKALGAKIPLGRQERMPMAHRRGIDAKSSAKEERRRHDAKENGIILEKASAPKKNDQKRIRGVDSPAVGRFRGGVLQLSRRDLSSIKGRHQPGKRRK